MAESSAEVLLRRLASGDHEALGEIYDRFAGLVNALAIKTRIRTAMIRLRETLGPLPSGDTL